MTPEKINGIPPLDYIRKLLHDQNERLVQHIELLDAADRELTESKFERVRSEFRAGAEALKLQHTEFLRRLHDLNGEAERLRTIQANYWPREAAESYVKEQATAQQALLRRVDETREALEKAAEETRKALEKQTAETTKRLEDQIRELRDADKISGGAKAGSAEVITRLLAGAAVLASFVAYFQNA
jgi:hypothetical protein